ncbi:DUF167 domain-containing protein [Desulfovibrio litoralis]|uniref:UPF0235 protein SAMN02745728_02039 n=1 Tax=Desulfovibrio litoralis DSM 11393 TaxID=1121455 RepID=A0A1M7TI17_9BACT|nr:DUF167 domain-containing protein [Desulfovibrio litoralis]SHN70404.1 hypothetical protein SAMN02745728_02039 [Desulfovibrio litoralis DSM 11393]
MQTKKTDTENKLEKNQQIIKNNKPGDKQQPEWLKENNENSFDILVWVQPNAKKNAVVGCYEGRLKIRLTAQAVDNKANKALLVYLAKLLKLKAQQLEIQSGETARQKRIRIEAKLAPLWENLVSLHMINEKEI